MADPWDLVVALQRDRQLCADDLAAIKSSCARDHAKPHVAQCSDCWPRLLDRIRDRYHKHAASPSKDNYLRRQHLLQDIDHILAKAKSHPPKDLSVLKQLEQRLQEEKKAWARDKVKSLDLQPTAKSTADVKAFQQKVADTSVSEVDLAAQLNSLLGHSSEVPLASFLRQIKDSKSPQDRFNLYVQTFFPALSDPAAASKLSRYTDSVRGGAPVPDVLTTMLRENQAARGNREERKKLEQNLQELTRAKAAHAADVARKQKARQDKIAAVAAASRAIPNLPPCSACSKALDPHDFRACPLCQVLSDLYGLGDDIVNYCSDRCQERNFDTHVTAAHSCNFGPQCSRNQDTDVEMDEDALEPVICRECVGTHRIPSSFCSARCYQMNFQTHRDSVHLPERKKSHNEWDDENQLDFAEQDKSQYGAKKIEDHIILLSEAVAEYQEKTGIRLV